MQYHPIIGIIIFLFSIFASFILGRLYLKKKLNLFSFKQNKNNNSLPKGEITSPDAPWIEKK